MQQRLLIINCPSEYFVYIPMGTFGICVYLAQKGFQVKLLNLALYNKTEVDDLLKQYINIFKPTHIGLIFHWQETAEEILYLGEKIKSSFNDVKIICGGFTAGYFAQDIIKTFKFIDYVIIGDPEKPLELLLGGSNATEIPNLTFRDDTGIKSNEVSYFIDQETLSSMSFAKLEYLYDYDLYIKAFEKKLGFPVFIGRGCLFSCQYCGGSSMAFRFHSRRARPVVRSLDAIIADMEYLKKFTRKIYICYEVERKYIKAIFIRMKQEKLEKTFQLNYGAWKLFDEEFLDMYRDIFIYGENNRPLFELSPEVYNDQDREKVKDLRSAYSLKDLKKNLYTIKDFFDDSIDVSIFFSRYHNTTKNYEDMRREITGIFQLKNGLMCDDFTNINVCYDHLSTDIASCYWESYVKNRHNVNTLISAIKNIKEQGQRSFTVNNLCIYMPDALSDDDVLKCELLTFILNILERHFHETFHILFKCLDELLIILIEDIINEVYINNSGNVFKTMDQVELLNLIKLKITKNELLLSKIPFIDDIMSFSLKKALYKQRNKTPGTPCQTSQLILNREFISVHNHDYLDLQRFLKGLTKEGINKLKPEETVFIFLVDNILSMTLETYNMTIKEFEKRISSERYYELMRERRIFSSSYHENLIEKLFQSNVLILN